MLRIELPWHRLKDQWRVLVWYKLFHCFFLKTTCGPPDTSLWTTVWKILPLDVLQICSVNVSARKPPVATAVLCCFPQSSKPMLGWYLNLTVISSFQMLSVSFVGVTTINVRLQMVCSFIDMHCKYTRSVGYMNVVEALLPYRNATNIFLQISKKCFILQNIN
jgi:hypothetical protein